jgi:hypothetical protein
MKKKLKFRKNGLSRDLNPGPLAPEPGDSLNVWNKKFLQKLEYLDR